MGAITWHAINANMNFAGSVVGSIHRTISLRTMYLVAPICRCWLGTCYVIFVILLIFSRMESVHSLETTTVSVYAFRCNISHTTLKSLYAHRFLVGVWRVSAHAAVRRIADLTWWRPFASINVSKIFKTGRVHKKILCPLGVRNPYDSLLSLYSFVQ